MSLHHHNFVEQYQSIIGYGFNRSVDQATLTIYLQKFSDDDCIKCLLERMSQKEMDILFEMLSALLRKYLNGQEYHNLFLKDYNSEFKLNEDFNNQKK